MCPRGSWCSPQQRIHFPSANALTPIIRSQHSGVWEAGCSAPARPHLFLCIFLLRGRKIRGHIPIRVGRHRYLSKLILGHTATVVEKAGCRAKNLPASLLWKAGQQAGCLSSLLHSGKSHIPLRVISLANKNRKTTVINRNHSLENDPKSEPCW